MWAKADLQVSGQCGGLAPPESKISNKSPVGRALLGHKVGDDVEVETPSKKVAKFTITKIR